MKPARNGLYQVRNPSIPQTYKDLLPRREMMRDEARRGSMLAWLFHAGDGSSEENMKSDADLALFLLDWCVTTNVGCSVNHIFGVNNDSVNCNVRGSTLTVASVTLVTDCVVVARTVLSSM